MKGLARPRLASLVHFGGTFRILYVRIRDCGPVDTNILCNSLVWSTRQLAQQQSPQSLWIAHAGIGVRQRKSTNEREYACRCGRRWRSILLLTGLRPVLKLLDLYPLVPVASTKKPELNQTRSSRDQR